LFLYQEEFAVTEMPGLRYQGPAAASVNNSNRVVSSSPFQNDMHLPAATVAGGLSWESLAADLRNVQQQQQLMPIGGGEPLPYLLLSHRQKAAATGGGRKPSSSQQLPAAAWMSPRGGRGRGRVFVPQQSTKQLLLDGSSVVGVTSGSSESDDLAAMVHDFIENDSGDLLDHSDSDCGSPNTKRSESLQVVLVQIRQTLESSSSSSSRICFLGFSRGFFRGKQKVSCAENQR
jgi:hypothetical protein